MGREIRSTCAGGTPSEIGAFSSGIDAIASCIGDIASGYVAFCSGMGDIASGCVAFCSGIDDIASGYVAFFSGCVAFCSGYVAFFSGIDTMGLGEAQSSQKSDLPRFKFDFSGSGKGINGILSERHPDTLTSMNNLASTYWAMGRHDDALQLQQALEGLEAALGPDHPSAKAVRENLRACPRKAGS